MMRIIIILSLLLHFDFETKAQTIRLDEESSLIVDTVVTSDYAKNQLFSNALAFVSDRFKNSQNVIEQNNLELGELFFIGNISKSFPNVIVGGVNKKGKKEKDVAFTDKTTLYFKCRIYFKDNRYKIVLSNLEVPFSEILNINTRLPLTEVGEKDSSSTIKGKQVAYEIAENFIKDVSASINKKPENDF